MVPFMRVPGVLSGAAFAFVTSFDEVVVAQFLASASQRTLPLQMFTGLREQLSPAITAGGNVKMLLSVLLLLTANLLIADAAKLCEALREASEERCG